MKIKYYLKYFKDYLRLKFNSNGNTKFSKQILRNIKKGIYLDIGCYHPFKDSQTSLFYKKGWRGVNLDISKETIDMFNIFRPKDINLHLGLSTKNGKQFAYYEGNISTVSSLDKNYLKKIGRKNKKKNLIEVITLNNLRKKYKINIINFLKLDCESIDEAIIMKSSLKDLDCNYLSIELLPQTQFGWENYKLPKKNINNYCKDYFLKSKMFKKLKKKFLFHSNDRFSFLLKRK
jgi:hypothetical protein